jgi:hypothetical protein
MSYRRTNIFPYRYAAAEALFALAILDTIRREVYDGFPGRKLIF